MPTVKFSTLRPTHNIEVEQALEEIQVRCKKCGGIMALGEVDRHAKWSHNATSVTVDTNPVD